MRREVRGGLGLAMAGCLAVASLAMLAPSAHAAESTATQQKTEKKVEPKKIVKYVGSSESKKYHRLSCEWAKKISKEHRVEFASAAAARSAGYEPCKVCIVGAATPLSKSSPGPAGAGKTGSKSPSPKTGQ